MRHVYPDYLSTIICKYSPVLSEGLTAFLQVDGLKNPHGGVFDSAITLVDARYLYLRKALVTGHFRHRKKKDGKNHRNALFPQ
jgi:hypothetical protein